MNARKFLTSAIAASTIVGTIGLAYAQTSTDPTTPATPSEMNRPVPQAQPAPDTSTMPRNAPAADTSTPAPAAASDSSTLPAGSEPAPKPDRN